MSQTILISGATGFAGGFLAEHYLAMGWHVHGTYRDPIDDVSWIPARMRLHQVDLLEAVGTDRLVERTEPDVIVHLAAQSSVRLSWQDPAATLHQNTMAQLNVLESARKHVRNATIVVVGSCDEYGAVAPSDNPIAETQDLQPLSPYAVSKVTQDLMGYQYAISHGMRVIRTRPFLQTGPRRSDHFAAGGFARRVAEVEAGMQPAVIDVGNVDLVRDFTDVRDVARAYAMLAAAGEAGQVYNIASGVGHTLRDLVQAMLQDAGVDAEIRESAGLRRSGEPPVLVGSPALLRDATGWQPRISFEESAVDTLSYWRDRVREAQEAIT